MHDRGDHGAEQPEGSDVVGVVAGRQDDPEAAEDHDQLQGQPRQLQLTLAQAGRVCALSGRVVPS